MGNYRFRLSDMVPNSWYYKLQNMGKTKTKNKSQIQPSKKKQNFSSTSSSSSSSSSSSQNFSNQRKSYYFSRNLNPRPPHETSMSKNPLFTDPPRKSSKQGRNTSTKRHSVSHESVWTKQDSTTPEEYPNSTFSSSSSSDDESKSSVSRIDLPPIITKPKKAEEKPVYHQKSLTVKIVKEEQQRVTSPRRRVAVNSSNGVKLRTKSPRIVSRKSVSSSSSSRVVSSTRKNIAESFAVVKSSNDPQKDFRESMMEMIMENNIWSSKDLEELLACYLSLNSDQYHDLIIKVFKQIWFDIITIQQ